MYSLLCINVVILHVLYVFISMHVFEDYTVCMPVCIDVGVCMDVFV